MNIPFSIWRIVKVSRRSALEISYLSVSPSRAMAAITSELTSHILAIDAVEETVRKIQPDVLVRKQFLSSDLSILKASSKIAILGLLINNLLCISSALRCGRQKRAQKYSKQQKISFQALELMPFHTGCKLKRDQKLSSNI